LRGASLARASRRAETWLWTGPIGHLLGGGLDFLVALARYGRARAKDERVIR
jgi:hypothetical protein